MSQVVLHHLDGHRALALPALERMRAMRVAQPVRAGFSELLRIDALQAVGRLRQERLDRLVQARGRPRCGAFSFCC